MLALHDYRRSGRAGVIRFATRTRAYASAGARIISPRSFLKRTCSHAIPYKKVDAVRRNVPLEIRYMCVAQIHTTRAHTRTRA